MLCIYSFNENAMFVTTPPVDAAARHLAIVVALIDESRINTDRTFEYLINPVFTDIKPLNHLTV